MSTCSRAAGAVSEYATRETQGAAPTQQAPRRARPSGAVPHARSSTCALPWCGSPAATHPGANAPATAVASLEQLQAKADAALAHRLQVRGSTTSRGGAVGRCTSKEQAKEQPNAATCHRRCRPPVGNPCRSCSAPRGRTRKSRAAGQTAGHCWCRAAAPAGVDSVRQCYRRGLAGRNQGCAPR